MPLNGVLLQYFHWYLATDGDHWRRLSEEARSLREAGFTALWLPPMGKGNSGVNSVGYDAYDLFDLGEFDQKGTVRTKYGTRAELDDALAACRAADLEVYADIVFNHKDGGDELELVYGQPVDRADRNRVLGDWEKFHAYTRFTFPGRGDRYSPFKWHWRCFDSLDYNADTRRVDRIYRLRNKRFETGVSHEHGNFDFLMACDIDTAYGPVREELNRYGQWLVDEVGIDGFRLDAVKHIDAGYFPDWLRRTRERAGRDLFAVGEYWSDSLSDLIGYLNASEGCMSLFDRPLQARFMRASHDLLGTFDMRTLFDGTLVGAWPTRAVTFVENHDTQPMCSLESTVLPWFKPHAYALILLREAGYPCVFYADYYGAPEAPRRKEDDVLYSHRFLIDRFLRARDTANHGVQRDYFDHPRVVGWTRSGENHPAMAVLMTNGFVDGWKWMEVGRPGASFVDVTGHDPEPVEANLDGWACFRCPERSLSVWIEQPNPLRGQAG